MSGQNSISCLCSVVVIRWLCVFVRRQKHRRLEQDRRRILKRTVLGTYWHADVFHRSIKLNLPSVTKRLLSTLVWPIATYSCESWTFNKKI